MQISPVLTPFIFPDFRGKFFPVQRVCAMPTGPSRLTFWSAFTGVPGPSQEVFLVPVPPQPNSVEVKALPIQTNQGDGCLREPESTEKLQQSASKHTIKPTAVTKYRLTAFHIAYPDKKPDNSIGGEDTRSCKIMSEWKCRFVKTPQYYGLQYLQVQSSSLRCNKQPLKAKHENPIQICSNASSPRGETKLILLIVTAPRFTKYLLLACIMNYWISPCVLNKSWWKVQFRNAKITGQSSGSHMLIQSLEKENVHSVRYYSAPKINLLRTQRNSTDSEEAN